MAVTGTPSPALRAANRRLQQLRAAQATTATPRPAPDPGASAATPLPAHLGWESSVLADHLRAAAARRARSSHRAAAASLTWLPATAPAPSARPPRHPAPPSSPATVTLHPSLALALLDHDQAAVGRVWLLLRHLDEAGRGWLALPAVRAALTTETSPLRVCGARHLRNLLHRGEGTFWQTDAERIWLRSTVRVAAALGVSRLHGAAVHLPLDALLQGVGHLRAHLYASFHSSRATGGGHGGPIARATLERVTGVPRRTQQRYEAAAGVTARANYALGEAATAAAHQEQAWAHGPATFRFHDRRGHHGEADATYVAWQLPNDYVGPHRPSGRRAPRRLNRDLADLQPQGGGDDAAHAGNDRDSTAPSAGNPLRPQPYARRYYQNGAAAHRRRQGADVTRYWRSPRARRGLSLWYVLPEGRC